MTPSESRSWGAMPHRMNEKDIKSCIESVYSTFHCLSNFMSKTIDEHPSRSLLCKLHVADGDIKAYKRTTGKFTAAVIGDSSLMRTTM